MVFSPSCANSTVGEKVEPSASARRSTVRYSPFWTVYCCPPSLITANIVCFSRSNTAKTAHTGRAARWIVSELGSRGRADPEDTGPRHLYGLRRHGRAWGQDVAVA